MKEHFIYTFLMPVKPFAISLGAFERVRQPMIRRVHACIGLGGGHLGLFYDLWLDKQ